MHGYLLSRIREQLTIAKYPKKPKLVPCCDFNSFAYQFKHKEGKKAQMHLVSVFAGSLSGDSIKKEKFISSYGEMAQVKAETGNCESALKTSLK